MTLPLSASANQIPYASSVASQLAQFWFYDPSYALAQDPEAPEKQVRDLVISGSLDHLQRLIVGHEISFEPDENDRPGRALADILEKLTKRQRFLPQSLYNLARATHRGAAWGLIYPEKQMLKIGDGKLREWTVIGKIRDVDKRRFRLTQAQYMGKPPEQRTEIKQDGAAPNRLLGLGSMNGGVPLNGTNGTNGTAKHDIESPKGYDADSLGSFRWEFHRGWNWRDSASLWWQPIENTAPYERWIQHVPDTSEWGMGYGYALADELQAYAWMKQKFLQWITQGAERWGQGFLYAKIKSLRDGFAKGTAQAQAFSDAVNRIRTWRSENFAAVDQDTDIALLDMPAEGARFLWEGIKYFDAEMTKRILAALQPTGNTTGAGSFSSAKVEEGSTESMILYLRSPLQESWTRTAGRFLIEQNEGNLRELGLWDIPCPGLRLHGKEHRDPKEMLEVFKLAKDLKIPVRQEDFYTSFGLAAPNEEDEVIKYPAEPALGSDPLAGLDGAEPGAGFKERLPIGEGLSSIAEGKDAA